MAQGAIRWESGLGMVRIGRAVEIGEMTGGAGGRKTRIDIVLMTRRALYARMSPRQRKRRCTVIERGACP